MPWDHKTAATTTSTTTTTEAKQQNSCIVCVSSILFKVSGIKAYMLKNETNEPFHIMDMIVI